MNSLAKTAKQLQRHYVTLITGDIHPVDHPVAKGDAREHGWRELLRRFLPDRYGVKSGFIIDASGELSKQIDCIIYRKDMGIELYAVGHHTVIPAEVVFAAFEIKPKIDSTTLKYAQDKADSIAKLKISNRWDWKNKGKLTSVSAAGEIIFGLLADNIDWKEKWNAQSFIDFFKKENKNIMLFMTVDDGCVDVLFSVFPTDEYTFCDGEHGMLNLLIRLAEAMVEVETWRCMSSCCLTKYKDNLAKPMYVKV